MALGPSTSRDPLGKAIVVVFLFAWTVGAGAIAAVMLGGALAVKQNGMPGAFAGVPALMAIVPVAFVVIGVLMLIRVLATPSGASREVYREVASPPAARAAPAPPSHGACLGCGSRKNVDGATICAYCGGNLGANRA